MSEQPQLPADQIPPSTTEGPTTSTNQSKEDNSNNEATRGVAGGSGGLCPVKPEFLRTVVQRISMDADGKTRGMNKGSAREHTELVAGTEAPTFEGEVNFLKGEQLTVIKQASREARKAGRARWEDGGNKKRERDDVNQLNKDGGSVEEKDTVPQEVKQEEDPKPEASTAAGDAQAETKERAASVTRKEEIAREREEKIKLRDKLFRNKSILAPLTTVGNLPFRRVCKDYGVDVTLSEMAMVYNLNQIQKSEWSLLRRHESEDIFGIQLGVSKPEDARIFAKSLAASDFQYDYIDINCGCPVELMVSRGCGCGLMAKKSRLRGVVKELVENQPMPVTIKCRIGEDEVHPTLHNVIGDFEDWGASAVTIHGRSRKQRYTKLANWEYIERVAKLTNLPVVGNGDILAYDDVVDHRTHCPSVSSLMTGRGALIKPWLFDEWNDQIPGGRDISSHERFEMLKKYCDYGMKHWGADERGILTVRKFLCEWLSFLCRYVPIGILERVPQRMNDRPPFFSGRDDLETLMASESAADWIKISEMLLGPSGDKFKFTPKHKSNSYSVNADGSVIVRGSAPSGPVGGGDGDGDQG